ncbi:MAG: sigma-70 family RNA polymerase sigma factor [Clostridia bacterium]|nr:sigma-70 family RNA polymerase sigma factor [Clostridia bacterium]MBQ5356002.1 sigma-70 family RNA polymerase sigma factor [Clostridia bacterium]
MEARLTELNLGLVTSVAMRFRGRGAENEDLIQIGSIGLLKAIRSFDPGRGFAFSTYAVPLIIGEIRRFLRDDGAVKVSRGLKRTGALLMKEREKVLAERGEEPRLAELAERLHITPEEAAAALDAASPVRSLTEAIGEDDFSLEDVIPDGEDGIGKMIERLALSETVGQLPPLWRQIVTLRYFREYSQQQTADALGLTQVKISREEKKIFAELRRMLA